MKKFIYTVGLWFTFFSLCLVSPARLEAAFSTADLAGTWYFSDFSDHPFSSEPGWITETVNINFGTVTINASGTVTGGNLVDSHGFSQAVTGGSLSLTSGGVLSGFITAGGIINTISQGQMDVAKTTALFVGADSRGYRFTGSVVKAGGSFSTADLEGTWYFSYFSDSPFFNDPGWVSGTVNIDSSGTVTGGNLVDSNGFSQAVAGGSLSLGSGGVLSGSITAGGIINTISQGEMDVAKTTALFVGVDSQGYRFTGSVVKAGGSFSTADLTGTWHFFDFSDYPFFNDPGWVRGTVNIDSSGTVTGGNLVDSNGVSASVTGGSLSLTIGGVLSGFITAGGTINISQGKMDVAKTTASFVGGDSRGYRFTGSVVKAVVQAPADFNGDGISDIGVFRGGSWYLDLNGNDKWDGCSKDGCFVFGLSGDQPVVGDWTGSGQASIGVYRDGSWYLDLNGNDKWDGCSKDGCFAFGLSGDQAVVGDWTGSGQASIGVYRDGSWYLDLNGNGKWDGCSKDECTVFGLAGDIPAN